MIVGFYQTGQSWYNVLTSDRQSVRTPGAALDVLLQFRCCILCATEGYYEDLREKALAKRIGSSI